jgi:hypothetical protein
MLGHSCPLCHPGVDRAAALRAGRRARHALTAAARKALAERPSGRCQSWGEFWPSRRITSAASSPSPLATPFPVAACGCAPALRSNSSLVARATSPASPLSSGYRPKPPLPRCAAGNGRGSVRPAPADVNRSTTRAVRPHWTPWGAWNGRAWNDLNSTDLGIDDLEVVGYRFHGICTHLSYWRDW